MEKATVGVTLYYEPRVSVNHCYNNNNPRHGICPDAEAWMWELRGALNTAIDTNNFRLPGVGASVQVDISIQAPRRKGRLPDTSNFRKLINDIVAATFGMDDQRFGGTDHVAVRTELDEDPCIYVVVIWQYAVVKGMAIRDDSAMAHGPISDDMKRRLGLHRVPSLCIGYGSAYCLQVCSVEVPLTCPETFNPGQYEDGASPCKVCKQTCPCLTNTQERTDNIEAWWAARKRSTKFARENWR